MMTNFNSKEFPVLYDMSQPEYPRKLFWNYEKNPHALISGSTGSGKTYFLLLLCGKISSHVLNGKLWICDFKNGDDFRFLDEILEARHFIYSQCLEGIEQVYSIFKERLEGDQDRSPIFLLIDEFSSLVHSQDKKQAEHLQKQIGMILMMGRSLNIHVIISAQRPDTAILGSGSREQFGFNLGLGRLSPEAKQMLFGEEKSQISQGFQTGEGRGYLLQNGASLKPVAVPRINRMYKLEEAIIHAVTR